MVLLIGVFVAYFGENWPCYKWTYSDSLIQIKPAYHKPFSLSCFNRNSNLMEISFCYYPNSNKLIATIFAHNTTAVLSWYVQKFVAFWWSVMALQQQNFPSYWNCGQKSWVKWAGGHWEWFWIILDAHLDWVNPSCKSSEIWWIRVLQM